jgi:hypothetical protein
MMRAWQDEYNESMKRLYIDEFDERREEKGDQFLIELRSSPDDDKCRRHSSRNSWIASENNLRDW